MAETILKVEEAAAYVRAHPQTVRRWAREGKLRGYYAGKQMVFKLEDLDQFLQPVGEAT
jgi:excisionase family DNA binding protein